MIVYLNNQQVAIDENCSLLALLESKEITAKSGIAVAVNNVVINSSKWQSKILSENDKILVISATKGG
ncbi:MAG: sulfur carrier protein ThiS [Mangrovibacterium sp.]